MIARFLAAFLISYPSLFAIAQCKDDDIDSLMMAMPANGMDGIYIRQQIDLKLQKLPIAHRMEHAWRIIHYLDSSMTTMDDDARVVALYLNGVIYGDVMNLRPQAMTAESEGAALAEKIGNNFLLASCIAQLINNSCRVQNYAEVFRLGPLFFTLQKKIDSTIIRPYRTFDFQQKLGVTCLVAESFMDVKQLDSAMHYYSMAEKEAGIVKKMNIPDSRADFWVTIASSGRGAVYELNGEYEKAIPFNISMLKLGITVSDWRLATESALGISLLYTQLGKLDLAQHYLDTAKILNSTGTPNMFSRQRTTEDKAQALIVAARGDYRQAWELTKNYSQQMEEAAKKHQADNVTSLLAAYDYEHNQRAISKLNQENQIKEERIRFQWTIFGAVIVVIILAVAFAITFIWNYRKQKRINKLIEDTKYQIVQSEKMASLGQMATDLVVQISEPVNTIHAHVDKLKKNLAVIKQVMDEQEKSSLENFKEQLGNLQLLKNETHFSGTWEEVDIQVKTIKSDAAGTAAIITKLGRSLSESKPES